MLHTIEKEWLDKKNREDICWVMRGFGNYHIKP
jgi:hypothetical protein